ncbi:MAG TPA: hypothetical protein VKS60_15390 [Stellaceae bacterium]|nr:hypothetical protein [Stellaceae bacterium]
MTKAIMVWLRDGSRTRIEQAEPGAVKSLWLTGIIGSSAIMAPLHSRLRRGIPPAGSKHYLP